MGLLRRRDFLLIFVAFALSHVGDYLALITLTLRIEEATGSGWAVAALLLTGLLPPLLLAPVVGLLVDRLETVRVLGITAIFQAAVAAGLAFTSGVVPTLALSFLLGTGVAVTQPALFALLPRAVGEDRVTQGNAYLEVARWGGAAAGPVLAATLTAAFGAQTALLANAGTFLVVAALVPLLRVRRPPEPSPAEDGARGEARQGIAFLARDPLLRLVVPVLGLMIVFAAADNVAEVFFAKDVLLAGDTGYGVLITTWTIGMVVGSTATGRWVRPQALGPVVMVGSVVGGIAVVIAAAASVYPIAVAMFLVGGVANGLELVAMRSLLHHRVPDRLRGRAFAAYYGIVQAAQIIALGASGGLVELAGARMTMLYAGAGTAAVGVLGMLLYLRIPSTDRRMVAAPTALQPWVPA
jgi:MFS family permease